MKRPFLSESHRQFPTKVHRFAAGVMGASLLLLVLGEFGNMGGYLEPSWLMFLGSLVVLFAADLYQMLKTGKGDGRLDEHVNLEDTPISFLLHVAWRLIVIVGGGITVVVLAVS